ncbi:glycosyltransferase [uncultured Ilyobacter sp.]|uniref:glycosyltransferase n=1 Tax=uncultured Ilyobacter sp. TaxID=544433 RepID=UPI002AA64D19|nr:glycosyltransferase [uncultured Ilyobacter sp.]
MKRVVIVLSAYNNEKIIEKCLLSCLKQDYPNLYVVMADDGSTDNTLAVANKLNEKYKNLIVLSLPHGERGIARLKALEEFEKLKGDFLYIIDSDMILEPHLIENCVKYLDKNPDIGALIIPELAFSDYTNFFSKVKVFERNTINNAGEDIGKNSIEAARFWRREEYSKSGGINSNQIAFEETQPTIRYLEIGGKIKRAVFTGVKHDEKMVTLKNILEKKKYYFSVMNKTIESEKSGFLKTLKRWYFFRPVLYRKENLLRYLKQPILFLGLVYMYTILSFIGVFQIIRGIAKKDS